MLKKNIKIYKEFYLSILIFLFGFIFTFNYWWNGKVDPSVVNIYTSFMSYGFSALLLTNFITKNFLLPQTSSYSIFTIDENKVKKIIEEISEEKYKKTKLINGFILIGTLMLYIFLNYFFLNSYAEYQIKNFGVKENIKIENISKSLKGFDLTTLKYDNVEKEFFLNNYKVGEVRTIIYSKNKPEIAEWYEE